MRGVLVGRVFCLQSDVNLMTKLSFLGDFDDILVVYKI